MPSSYPTGLDAFTTGTLTGVVSGSDHGNKGDAINKIEAELGVSPSSGQASVAARLDSLCVNVKDYGATGDGSTNDRAAVQAAIDALPASGGTVLFPLGDYRCSTALDLDDTRSVVLRGLGGLTGGAVQASRLVFTGTGSGTFLSARSTFGFKLIDLAVCYTSTSFTGTLINLSQSAALVDTSLAVFDSCLIGSGASTIRTATLLLLDKAILTDVRGCSFSGGAVGVLGRTAAGNYSNSIRFSGCAFLFMETMAVRNPGQAWLFNGCTFQQLYTGGSSAGAGGVQLESGYTAAGLSLNACWLGDANTTGNWVDFRGSGLSLTGNYFSTGAKGALVSGASTFGIYISGNQFASVATAVDLGTGQSRCMVMGNDYSSVTTPIAAGDSPHQSIFEYPIGSTSQQLVFSSGGNGAKAMGRFTVGTELVLPVYTVAGRPGAGSVFAGTLIYVSDAAANNKLQYSDGAAWIAAG